MGDRKKYPRNGAGTRAPPVKARGRIHRFSVRFALILGGLLAGLVVAEVIIHLFAPQYFRLHIHPARIWQNDFMSVDRLGEYDQLLGWRLKPNASTMNEAWEFSHEIRTNSRGFRDDETPLDRRPGTRRVLLVGDSYGMGDGVPRGALFADRLEKLLDDTEVVNLCVQGYSTDQEMLLYQREGVQYKPDAVLLALTLANDILDNTMTKLPSGLQKPYFLSCEKELSLKGVPVPFTLYQSRKVPVEMQSPFPIHDWLDSHCGVYALAFHLLSLHEPIRRCWEETGLIYKRIALLYRQQIDCLRNDPCPGYQKGWAITEKILKQWGKTVQSNGSVPALIVIPHSLQVYPKLWEQALAEHCLAPGDFSLEQPGRRLAEFCRPHGIHVLDLLPGLRRAAPESLPLYYFRNPHWTEEGHRVTAGLIAEFLREEIFPLIDEAR